MDTIYFAITWEIIYPRILLQELHLYVGKKHSVWARSMFA